MDAESLAAQLDFVARSLARLGVAPADVEDLTQEVVIVAIRRADTFDRARRIEPWLFGIARNLARDFRRLARHRVEQPEGDAMEVYPSTASSPADDTHLKQRALLLRAAVAELDEPLQELIVLHDLEEIPMAEVAASIGLAIDTAYARLRKARAKLRMCLGRPGGLDGIE